MNRLMGIIIPVTGVLLLISSCSQERSTPVVTLSDYARAEKMLPASTAKLVYGDNVRAVWIDKDNFWYTTNTPDGHQFILVNSPEMSRRQAFDHEKLAVALSEQAGGEYDAINLPLTGLEFSEELDRVSFMAGGSFWQYDIGADILEEKAAPARGGTNAVVSPDGKKEAFIRNYNLWARDLATGRESALTTDGVKDFGYATNNAGWTKRDSPILLWSPDSKKIATFQHDGRGVGEMYLVTTNVGHPVLEAWKYPLPEDSVIFRIHRVVIHLEGPGVVRLKMAPDQHRSTTTDHIATRGGQFADIEWNQDGSRLAFVSTSRDHRNEVMRIADPYTGDVSDLLEENVDTFYESGYNGINWKLMEESNEFIWFSKRSNWGHLYLHDLATGELKKQITEGDWNVLQILHIDRENRRIYFNGNCREPGDPYFIYLYSINIDGSDLTLHTPDSAYHSVTLAPDASCFIDSYSTPVNPPVTCLINIRTGERLDLERADISKLSEAGWSPPLPFSVKARDGETDLYGLMYLPSNFNSKKKYPIINYIYPGPQSGSVGSRSFSASRGDRQSIAELGFIVVAIDAMGTPMRSHSFHAAYYGNMGDNGLPDQIAGMKQLAEKYLWIDIDRVGIYGHSGGGFASTDAILRYPDFFRVAVSGAGNHDNRNYEDDWGEKWQGLLEEYPDGTTNYDNQANQLLAGNLKGKLLLAHGTMDSNVPYYNTLLVVNELIAANKDFDLILFPNRGHGFGNEPYMMRRRWDYFVEHLLGAEPPEEYEFSSVEAIQ